MKRQFLLEPAKTYHYINQSGCYTLDDVDDVKMFEMTKLAFSVLNITTEMSDGIFAVLSAILNVGNLEFKVLVLYRELKILEFGGQRDSKC